jgi:hypothetical protein
MRFAGLPTLVLCCLAGCSGSAFTSTPGTGGADATGGTNGTGSTTSTGGRDVGSAGAISSGGVIGVAGMPGIAGMPAVGGAANPDCAGPACIACCDQKFPNDRYVYLEYMLPCGCADPCAAAACQLNYCATSDWPATPECHQCMFDNRNGYCVTPLTDCIAFGAQCTGYQQCVFGCF